jgi:hypothetical protein
MLERVGQQFGDDEFGPISVSAGCGVPAKVGRDLPAEAGDGSGISWFKTPFHVVIS